MDNLAALSHTPEGSYGSRNSSVVEWSPPQTRGDADQAIISLSNDIGLILAQLAEDEQRWCERTGRSPADYAAWRRRALFAKVHKEGQLRECKRVRAQLAGTHIDHESVRGDRETANLLAGCRQVLDVWLDEAFPSGSDRLDQALAGLAEQVEKLVKRTGSRWDVDLVGVSAMSMAPADVTAD
jgi:hypothetical protein